MQISVRVKHYSKRRCYGTFVEKTLYGARTCIYIRIQIKPYIEGIMSKGPYPYVWQTGPFWQDALDIRKWLYRHFIYRVDVISHATHSTLVPRISRKYGEASYQCKDRALRTPINVISIQASRCGDSRNSKRKIVFTETHESRRNDVRYVLVFISNILT